MSTGPRPSNPIPIYRNSNAKVEEFTSFQTLPVQVQLLLLLQKSSFIVSFIVIITTVVLYGFTVCLPQIWDQDYRTLKELQRKERDLTMINENLKIELLEQSENNKNLTYPTHINAVFLTSDDDLTPISAESKITLPIPLLSEGTPVAY